MAPTFVGGATKSLVQASTTNWWQNYSDPVLNEFVEIGLSSNLDIRTALERIVAARQDARAFGLPEQVTGDASIDGRRTEANGVIDETLNASLDATFVFDIFGGFKRGREQSLAQLEAAQFDAGTVRLAYLADIVSAYVLVRYYETAASITRRSIRSRRGTLDVVNTRFRAEEATTLDVAQAQSLLRTAEASLPIIEAQRHVNAFRIATLLDVPTSTVMAKLSKPRRIPRVRGGMATGVPADLLRNRPDVRSAERTLAASTARFGVSAAQLFPSVSLGGTITTGDNQGWTLGPSITVPLFDQTRRRANRNIALSQARQAELAYRLEVRQAAEEVQTALVLVNARRRQSNALQQAASTSERVNNLTRTSFGEGLVPIDTVLDAERTVLDNQLQLALANSEWAQAWAQLQVALGKGWATTQPDPAVAEES